MILVIYRLNTVGFGLLLGFLLFFEVASFNLINNLVLLILKIGFIVKILLWYLHLRHSCRTSTNDFFKSFRLFFGTLLFWSTRIYFFRRCVDYALCFKCFIVLIIAICSLKECICAIFLDLWYDNSFLFAYLASLRTLLQTNTFKTLFSLKSFDIWDSLTLWFLIIVSIDWISFLGDILNTT